VIGQKERRNSQGKKNERKGKQMGIKTGNMTTNVTLRRVCKTIVAMLKPLSITYSECVSVALFIPPAKRMQLIIL
jgi:hypothetical protein